MKKLFKVFLTSILAVGICLGFAGCGEQQNQDQLTAATKTYYGVVQTIGESEELFVYIPTAGICELPSYEDEKEQDITVREGDLIRMDFEAEEVEFMKSYPAGIKTPAKSITVLMENVELVQSEEDYILTVDYTQALKDEFLAYEKGIGDTVYFMGQNDTDPVTQGKRGEATVEDISSDRLTLRFYAHGDLIQDLLGDFATRRVRLEATDFSSAEPLYSFFELKDRLDKSDIEKIEIAEYFGTALPNYLRPTEYVTSEAEEDIQTIYDWLKNLNNKILVEVTEEETYVEGGGGKVLTVYTKLGTFRITESAGRHLHIWDKYFAERNTYMPDIVGESVTYRFDDSADETLNFYKWGDFSRTYDIKLSDITFKSATRSYDEMLDVGFMLMQDVGAFKIFSPKLFYHEMSGRYYEIVGDTDFSIIFDTNETLSEKDSENIEVLKEAYEAENNPYGAKASVVNYYGEYASGAIVAMMTRSDMNYNEALWVVTVAGQVIEYNNGNRIIVFYDGAFCSLAEAYENGYLTEEDIATVAMKHSVFYYGLLDT